MKTLNLALLVALGSLTINAQVVNPSIEFVVVDPSGSCTTGQYMEYNTANGKFWGCANGTWSAIAGSGSTPGGATGQVQFNNAGSFDASSLFNWDILNGRLGINTASPSERLGVAGNISVGEGAFSAPRIKFQNLGWNNINRLGMMYSGDTFQLSANSTPASSTTANLDDITQGTYIASLSPSSYTLQYSAAGANPVNLTTAFSINSAGLVTMGSNILNPSTGILTPQINTGNGSTAGEDYLYELSANGTSSVSLKSPDLLTASYRLQFPAGAPAAGQALSYAAPDGTSIAAASWVTPVVATPVVAFASLPACAAGTEGSMRAISDSTTQVWGATITGGSTNHALAYCDGTNWTVMGK